MNDNSFLSHETEILGLARQFDFAIKLTEHDSYEKLGNADISVLATYAHEWTHYVQFLSTSLGDLLAETERNVFILKGALILEVSKILNGNISIPLVKLLETNHLTRTETISDHLQTLKILAACQNTFYTSWSNNVRNLTYDLSKIRQQRPFKLDPYAGTLIYTPEGKPSQILRISATQILEHAAKANELILMKGVFPNHLLAPEFFDYFGLYLFLYQERYINFESVSENLWRVTLPNLSPETGASVALALIFTCSQIALTLYSHPNYFSQDLADRNVKNAQGEITQTHLHFCEASMQSSSFVFCKLLQNFNLVSHYLATSENNNWFRIIDKICRELDLPLYSKMVNYNFRRALKIKEKIESTMSPIEEPSLIDTKMAELLTEGRGFSDYQLNLINNYDSLYLKYFYERSVACSWVFSEYPSASINPLGNADKFPSPYVLVEAEKGARRLVLNFPWQNQPKVFEIPPFIISYFQETHTIFNKILFENDLACYRTTIGRKEASAERASIGCPFFEHCYDTRKDSLLNFCKYDDWKRVANLGLRGVVSFGKAQTK